MKLLAVPLVILISAASALAGFKVPSSVFTTSELAEAQTKAQEEGKAIAFVYTNAGST